MKVLLNWLLFLALIAVCYLVYKYWYLVPWPTLPTMTGLQVIVFALSFAFMWVDVLRWGSVKPFNCLKCMTGWTALLLALFFHVELWYFYLPVGLFVGAMFEGIKMRWL